MLTCMYGGRRKEACCLLLAEDIYDLMEKMEDRINTGRALPPYDLAVTLTRLIKDGPLLTALNQQPANRLTES
ncbi:hypothetical protein J7E73_08880 [Paenibacillus albidus]|uniref:hypothetical protein n=1 Tax=Paenibacillus albidus TaxID=2041023 RepID=UPI001BE52FE7|nr:hypothetical protein [Paenibacillus albidus]MBT2289245.1 hypothetical protein [Paenibacillus albidus]